MTAREFGRVLDLTSWNEELPPDWLLLAEGALELTPPRNRAERASRNFARSVLEWSEADIPAPLEVWTSRNGSTVFVWRDRDAGKALLLTFRACRQIGFRYIEDGDVLLDGVDRDDFAENIRELFFIMYGGRGSGLKADAVIEALCEVPGRKRGAA